MAGTLESGVGMLSFDWPTALLLEVIQSARYARDPNVDLNQDE